MNGLFILVARINRFLLARLSRMTSPGREFIPEIDGLRCVAIVLVFLYHLHDQATQLHPALASWRVDRAWGYDLLSRGHIGVQLFFVISGFILGLPFAHHARRGTKPHLKRYFLRRVTRLEPPYLVNLALMMLLLVVVKGESFVELLGPWFASATYTHNLIYRAPSEINFVAWSLEIEAQFYLAAPLLAWLFRPRGILIPLVTWGCAFGLSMFGAWYCAVHPKLPTQLFTCLPLFLIGFLLAEFHAAGHLRRWISPTFAILAIGIASFGAIAYANHPLRNVLIGPCIGLGVAGVLVGPPPVALLRRPWIVTLGGMCYTIYLYHFLLLTAAGRFTYRLTVPGGYGANFALQVLLIAPVVFFGCAILFALFERPFMRPFKKKASETGSNRGEATS